MSGTGDDLNFIGVDRSEGSSRRALRVVAVGLAALVVLGIGIGIGVRGGRTNAPVSQIAATRGAEPSTPTAPSTTSPSTSVVAEAAPATTAAVSTVAPAAALRVSPPATTTPANPPTTAPATSTTTIDSQRSEFSAMFATFVPWSGQAIPAFANLRAERKLIGTLGATGDYYGQIDECKAVWENISGQTWPPPGGYVPNSGPWASPLTTAPDSELKRLFLDYLSTYDRVLVNPCISTGQRASAKASAVDDALVSREAAILSRLYSMRQSAERYDVAWQWPMGWDLPT